MKNTVLSFQKAKADGKKLTMLTAYDYSTAKLIDSTGVNSILVGDSLGNVMLGYDDTISVTMEDMIHHGKAVCRGAKNALVIVDMPFMSYQVSVEKAALVLSQSLALAEKMINDGKKDTSKFKEAMTTFIEKEPLAKIDYVEFVDWKTLEPVSKIERPVLNAIAVYIGKTRLIDNHIYE